MREILFKAKTISGNWVNGLLSNKDDKWYISNKAGNAYYPKCFKEPCCGMGECLDDNCSLMIDACKKMEEYEQLEEQGLLVRLPANNKEIYIISSRWTVCSKCGSRFDEYSCSGCEYECNSKKRILCASNSSFVYKCKLLC